MIPVVLRVLLILVSVWLLLYVLRSVRKARVQIDDIIFWMIFSVLLILLAVVPQIAGWFAGLIGVQSPANLIYLVIIFVLLLKIFNMSIKFSQLEMKIKNLTQELAVKEFSAQRQPGKDNGEADPQDGGKTD